MKIPNNDMFNVGSAQSGSVVSLATSNDENYPASTIIDRDSNTFWMTTGLYPQSVVVSFPQTVELKSLLLTSFGIKQLVIEKSSQSQQTDFDALVDRTLNHEDRRLQKTDIPLTKPITARHLKITIISGYDSFASIHNLEVNGKAPR